MVNESLLLLSEEEEEEEEYENMMEMYDYYMNYLWVMDGICDQ